MQKRWGSLALAKEEGYELSDEQLQAASGGDWDCWTVCTGECDACTFHGLSYDQADPPRNVMQGSIPVSFSNSDMQRQSATAAKALMPRKNDTPEPTPCIIEPTS